MTTNRCLMSAFHPLRTLRCAATLLPTKFAVEAQKLLGI